MKSKVGINTQPFWLVLKESLFTKGDVIQVSKQRTLSIILRILGFYYLLETKILKEPIDMGNNWLYEVKVNKTWFCWWKFKLKRICI